jgi:hypothetical protein
MPNHVRDSYTAAELASKLDDVEWSGTEYTVPCWLYEALLEHLRSPGPARPEWRKIEDGCGTPHAIHVTRSELEKEQPLTFWTMYLGEFYECRVYLYPVETSPPATTSPERKSNG